MEIEPIPADAHLVEIYSRLPGATLEAEEMRIRSALAELAGKLVAITQVREANNEYPVSA